MSSFDYQHYDPSKAASFPLEYQRSCDYSDSSYHGGHSAGIFPAAAVATASSSVHPFNVAVAHNPAAGVFASNSQEEGREFDCQAIHHCRSISITSIDSLGGGQVDEDEDEDDVMAAASMMLMHHQGGYADHDHQVPQGHHHRATPRTVSLVAGSLPRPLLAVNHDVEDKIGAMRRQETHGGYACPDYLAEMQRQQPNNKDNNCVIGDQSPPSSSSHPADHRQVDEFCREQICEWSFRVVDYFHINRDVVAIAMAYLDMFLARCPCDRKSFKLAATTCLYLAMKIHHEPEDENAATQNLHYMGILTNLSRGEFHESHIAEMERMVLHHLRWKVNPPIPSWYVSQYCRLTPLALGCATPGKARSLVELSCFYTELAVMDYYFVPQRPCLVGLAAILEALDQTPFEDVSLEARKAFEVVVSTRCLADLDGGGVATHAEELADIRRRLRLIYNRSQEANRDDDKANNTEVGSQSPTGRGRDAVSATSPVCVTRAGDR